MKHRHRKCDRCGWIHFPVSRAFAQAEVEKFNVYYASLSKQVQQENYGGKPANIKQYEYCWCGNHHSNFKAVKNSELPYGSTIGPIIYQRIK